MKLYNALLVFLFIFIFQSCADTQIINRMIKTEDGEFMMLGKQDVDAFKYEAFSNWFLDEYNSYQPNQAVLTKIKKKIGDYRIVVFFGSWCGDSKREIPRFMKIINLLKIPKNQIEIYAVNRKKESFFGEEQGKNILHVPTFIFYSKKKIFRKNREYEANRIIESPIQSLEEDMLKIVNQESYTPNYYY